MVRSRKYALITAALALILIAAVVLTVVLTGNGTYYDRAPEGSVSDAEVGISPTTGTVDNREEYLVTTLLKNSSIGNIANLTAENMQDLRNSNGDVYVAGAAKDGINDTYVIKLNPGVRLLTNDGWTTVENGDLNTETTYGGSGVFDVKYNGIWYRFENGTTGKPDNENGVNYNSLYQTFNNFLTKKGFYQQSYNYGLIVEPTGVVYYNPNDTSMLSWFDATLDGAGATIKPTAVLNFTWGNKYGTSWAHEVEDYEAGHDKDSAYKIDRGVQYIRNGYMGGNLTRNTEGGIGFVGLLFGAMRYGSFRNFIWSDDVEGLSGDHYFHYGSKKSGTAFGGLVGLAGPSDNMESGARSSIYNVQMDFNHNLDHRMGFGNHAYNNLADTKCDIYSGGLLGINLNADVELVDINYNGIQFSQYALRGHNHSYTGEKGEWGQSSFGGVIGAQSNVYRKDKMTVSKITVTGLKSATMYASATVEKEWGNSWSGTSQYNNIYTMIGGIIGGLYGNIDIKGVIFDMNYDKIFNMWHGGPGGARDSTGWQRGILVGHIFSSQFNTSDIYVTNKIFGADSYTSETPTISAIGNNKDYSMTVSPFGNYTTKYSYIGGVDENNSYTDTYKRFVYLDDKVVSSVSFTDDTYTEYDVNGEGTTKEYMLQISAPVDEQGVKKQGVMWDITYNVDKGSASNNHEYLYMQNLQDNVNLKGVSNISLTDQTAYMTMSIQYASSYNFELVNGHNDTGESTKVYNGERVDYATLDLTAQSATVIDDNYQPTYVQIGLDGKVTFYNDSNTTLTSMNNFRTSGNEQSSDFAKLASSLFQLEFATNVEEGLFNVAENWDAQVDVNTYRWSSLGLFAVETSDGRFVFAPETGTQAEIEITHRPISLNLLNPNAPYIGEAYSLEYNPKGGNYASVIDGKVHYNFTSSVDDKGGLIGTDVVSFIPSGGSFTARDAGSYVLNGELSGADSGNYQYSVGSSNFTIEPAQAVITINGGSMVYGTRPTQAELAGMVNYSVSFTNTGTYLSSGFAAADGITPSFNMQTSLDTATSAGWMFAGTGASVFNNNFPVDEYDVVVDALTGTGLKNYVVSDVVVETQFSVTPRPLTSTLPAVNGFIYGDAVAPTVGEPAFAGWASGDSIGSYEIKYYLSETDAEYTYGVRFGAGTYYVRAVPTAVNASGSANGLNNYEVNYNDPLFEVEKRDTYVSFDYDPSSTYVYKATAYDFKALALINGAEGDTVDDVLFAAYSDPERKNKVDDALNAGTYYPGATSETLSANYNILGVRDKNGNEWATFVIGRATVSLSLDKLTLVYNGAERDFDLKNVTISSDVESLQAELGGLKEKLVFLFNNSSVKPQDAATYNVTVNLPQQPNYNAATASLTGGLVIEQLGIVINASDTTVTYNGAVIPEIGFSVAAAPGADVSSLPEGWADKLAISVAYAKEDGSPVTSLRNVGTYSVTYTYDGSAGNFKTASKTITYKVDPKPLVFALKNKNVTYNKQAYVPDYDLTGAVIGDTVNAVLSASKDGAPVETIVDAGTYDITVSLVDGTGARAGNYTVAADGLQVVVAPYEIFAREINTTLFFNSGELGAAYYEGLMQYTVIDADGTDITKDVTVTPDLIGLDNDDAVETVDNRGGEYRAKLTLELPAGYNSGNYSVVTNVYNVYIYRIALRAVLSQESVTFGDDYNVKGQLYAMAGDGEKLFTVGADGVVAGFNEDILSDVTGLTVTSASMTITGSDLGGNAVDGTLSEVIDAIFNSGIYDAAKMANAGTYSVTVTVTVKAVYTESTHDREVTISAPFTWTVDPYEIKVTPGQLDTYYTEAITADDVMGAVVFEGGDEQYKSFVTAVSAAIGDGTSYVNAGEYDYDLVLDTTEGGYFNYTLPAVETGKINVQQLTVQVSAADATVEYGNAVTLSSAEVRIFKGDQDVTESVAGFNLSAQYPYSLTTDYNIGDPVKDYVIEAQPGSVTENFAFRSENGTLKVTQRSIGIKLDNIEMEYGTASLPEITFTFESGSLYGSDVVTLETSSLKITDGSSAEEVVAESDYDRIDANTYSYTFESITLSNGNYALDLTATTSGVTSGVLTVTPHQFDSVEWIDPAAALTYQGEAFSSKELHTIAAQTMDNGDVVTFGVNYGGEVRSAGIYTAIATVASVKNGEEDVAAGNYDVSHVATRSLTVGKASLTLAGVDNAGTMSVESVYNASAQALDPSRLVFTFGDATYDADRDGALGLTLSYAQGGVSVTPEHAGSYDVTVVLSSSNANFTAASLSGVAFVITRWELTAEQFKENVSVNIPENLKYTSSAQGATLSFTNKLANENIAYNLKYYVLGEEGAMVTVPEPVNAASYAVKVKIDTADVYYVSAESEGTLVIAPNDSIDLNGYVTADAGAGENAKYYTGGPLYPNVEATISGLRGAAAEIIVTDNSAFAFTFFVKDENGTEIDFAGNKVKVADPAGQPTAVTRDYYYVSVTFNPGGKFDPNYAADIKLDLVLEDGSPLVFQITAGSMLIRVNSGSTAEYNGLSGFNGRDVIYKDEGELWRINTEIITFVGVDLASMTDLISELKVGDITIDVAVYYGDHEETGIPLYSTLYTWEWLRSGGEEDDRSAPTKTVYTKPIREDVQLTTDKVANVQTKGPVNGIYDFGYSDGLSTATYLISVSVDNTVPGSEYSPAQSVQYDENGDIVTDSNNKPVPVAGPHTASGSVNIAPAETQFELFYTSDFYQSGANMLEGGYKELNELMEKAAGVPVELSDELLSGAHFYIRGVQIAPEAFANAPDLDDKTAVGTDGAYMVSNAGVSGIIGGNGYGGNVESANYSVGGYYYERISTGNLHITITDSEGNVVYTKNVSGQTDGSKNGGITDAGTYRISITFDGMPGKYSAYSYSCDFVQQKAEYHIVVSETAGANLTVEFGTAFDVSGLQDQLKIELETGENAVVTGSYNDFVTAFENFKKGDQSALDGFIKLVGTSGGGSTEYNGYETPVGDYYIYYVYESENPNLEVIMETSDSRIVVTPAAPELLLKTDGSSEYVADEKIIADSAYRAGYDWTDDLLSQVMLGLKYKDTEGVPVGEYYASNALAVSEVQYRVSAGSDWGMLTGSSIGAVGQYRISFVSTDDNLVGEAPYSLTFTVTKISATAYIINIDELNGQQYTGAQFALDSFYEVRDDADKVVPAAALAGTPEFNIYTQFDEDANDGAGAPVEESKVEFVRDAGTYYIAVSVTGSANYNVTPSQFVTITIEKADLRVRFAGESYSAVYNRASGNTVGSIYTYELNGRSITPSGVTEIYYLRGAADQTAVQEFVAAYLAALEGNETLTITQWLEANAETYAGYEFTSVNGKNAATDVGTYYPIVVYGGDTNFNKSARLIDNGVYPEFVITPAALRVEMVYNVNYEITYGDSIDDITGNDVVSQYATLVWNEQVGVGSDGQPVYSTIDKIDDFSAATGANIVLSLINRNVYAAGNAAGTYSSAFQLNVELTYDEGEYNNFELIYTPDFLDLTVAKKSVKVDIGDVAVNLGKLGQQTLVTGGVKFNGVYNGSSFGTLELVVGDGFVFGIAGYGETVVEAGSGKYGVLTVTMSGTLAEGGAMIAGSYSSSVDFALNNANYTIDLYDGASKLTTLGSIDGTPYSVPVSLDVAKAVLRVDFDVLTYKWLSETYTESVGAGSGEHQGWWEYATMYTGRNFRRNERLRIQSGYYNGNKWVPYGVYAQQVKLGDIINATELGIVVTDGESGMLAAAGEYSFHLAISSTNYEFERADKSRSSAIDVNITISPSEALEVNLNLAPLFTENENGKFWEREFDGMTITTRTIMGKYLEVYRYEIPQGQNALTDVVTLQRTSLGDVTDGVFAQGVNVTLAGDNAVGGSIIYAGDYDLIVNVNMDNMAERTEVAKLKITPAKQGSVDAEISNRSKSGMTYNGSSIVPSFDFKITVEEKLSGVTHTQRVNSYSVRVSKDGKELFTYAVEDGVVNMTDEQRAMLANAGKYTFELIVDSATMPNLEDGATFPFKEGEIKIDPRPITDSSIRSSYRESFDFKSANGEAVAVTKEGINFIAYYNRDTLLEVGTDYELAFVDEAGKVTEAGKYTGEYQFKVTGKGNFEGEIRGTYYIGASVGPTEAPAALTYGADDKIIVKLAVNSLAPGSADIINDIHLAFDDSARLVTEGGTTVSQLRLESISPEGGNFIAVFGGVGAVNAGTYYLRLSFSCEYEYVEGKVIGSGGEINTDVSGSEVCKVVVQPASAKAVADSVNVVLTAVNSNNLSFVIDGKANGYEYSIDGETWDKAYKGENTVTGLTPETKYTVSFRLNDSNYAEGGVTEYPLAVQLTDVYTTMNVDNILADAQDLAGNFNMTGFGRYVELMDDLNSVSVADREARAEEIEEALAAIEKARSEYMADLQAAIDSAVDTAEKATGKGIGVSAVGTAAVVGGAAMPAALGIGFIFAAARKRKSKEEDLND